MKYFFSIQIFKLFNSNYSNLGYALLGRALEKVVNTSYEEWVTKNILKPLNMKSSGFDAVAR